MSDPEHATPDPDELPALTPGLAIGFTISAAFLSLVIVVSLSSFQEGSITPGIVGIGYLVGYGTAFALARPFIADPPGPALGFTPAPLRAWIAVPLLLPAVLLISELENVLALLVPRPKPPSPDEAPAMTPAFVAQLVLTVVLVRPAVQEIFFRGLLQPRLATHWGPGGAVIGTAFLGALAAVPYLGGAPSSLVLPLGYGLIACQLRRAAGSIYPCLALGVGYGIIYALVSFEVFGIPGFDLTAPDTHTPLHLLVIPALLLGIGLSLCRPTDRPSPRDH